jgi:UDP-N-acetylmuramate: L-alanyl-gamma-D-glutamyl-meso-diaminopimelate ligase
MNIHIIGICGTFMGGVARLARDLGMTVTGSDANTYPPMNTQLESLGIELFEGYSADNIPESADIVIVGNTISRGNPELESVLDKGLRYTSGAQWLGDHVLQGRWVLAVAGTHGKTTTSSLLAWLLEQNDLAPGYLIGGVPENFGESARLGTTPFFVIEADEYDTAFCDKRSKFVHYQPRTLILNNLEFDHADIFVDLAAIQNQFKHLLKTVPQHGQIIYNQDSPALAEVLEMGYWSELRSFNSANSDWRAEKVKDDASEFWLLHGSEKYLVSWSLIGDHNMANAVAAIAAAHHVGIPIANSVESLTTFKSVKRRMEVIFDQPSARIFDDFAHHPTAISETLVGLRNSVGEQKIIAVLEPRSNTMKRGIHKHLLQEALEKADNVLIFADQNVKWDISELESGSISAFSSTELLLEQLITLIDGDSGRTNVVIMSNGGFENLYQRLIGRLS